MDPFVQAVVLAISFLGGWILRPYLVKRSEQQGEYDAILSNLDTIRTKVEVTERAAVDIKAEVELRGWRERERLTLYRDRIEAVLTAVHEVDTECSRQHSEVMADETLKCDPRARSRVQVLVSLYFPDLRPKNFELQLATLDFEKTAMKLNGLWAMNRLRIQAGSSTPDTEAEHDRKHAELADRLSGTYQTLLSKLNEMEHLICELIPRYIP